MIEDLVKRLRTSLSMLAQEEAADRIEELEAKLAKSMQHVSEYSNDPHLVGWARRNIAELKGDRAGRG